MDYSCTTPEGNERSPGKQMPRDERRAESRKITISYFSPTKGLSEEAQLRPSTTPRVNSAKASPYTPKNFPQTKPRKTAIRPRKTLPTL
jgi:hypothetical protein